MSSFSPSNNYKNKPVSTNQSTDFLQPIAVKSSQWSKGKVNINNLIRPVSAQGFLFPKDAATKIPPPQVPISSSEAVITDEHTEEISQHEFIKSLLKPKPLNKITINDNDRKIEGLNVELMDHQVLGLRFLVKREREKPRRRAYVEKLYPDEETGKSETFFNVGGILADDMGLGKTVQSIGLILKNQLKRTSTRYEFEHTTLIVCPASLITQWCSELNEKAPSLQVLSFHGSHRSNNSAFVHKYDIVITSYQTLNSESEKSFSPMFDPKYPFRRIILDEAQTIKNSLTKSNQACCKLLGKRRWCLTGTPIANKVDELHSLLKFLGVNQFEDTVYWNMRISSLLSPKSSSSDVSTALQRLHSILDKIMLRRTKAVLKENGSLTVKKNMHKEVLDFMPFERNLYSKLERKIINQIIGTEIQFGEAADSIEVLSSKIDLKYTGVFSFLIRLRQLCCHWELLFSMGKQQDCDLLMDDLKSGLLDKPSNDPKDHNVLDELLSGLKNMTLNDENGKEISIQETLDNNTTKSVSSIKIQRILNILKGDGAKVRKTIIFSEFTSMLDILAKVLHENDITFVQYDGRMDKTSKFESLERLKTSNVHVLLCSLKCGAYGLNITSCSRVILYEPFWNPAVGSQAIDRVYRYGQTKDVDVYEFFISDSIEMRIKELQEKKRTFMNAVIDKDPSASFKMMSNSLSKIEMLSLLGITVVDDKK